MMGRGVLANPWLIRQCHDHLRDGSVTPVGLPEKAAFMLAFLARVERELPAPIAIGKMKKMGGYLSKGIAGGARLRDRIHAARTPAEVMEVVEGYFAAPPEPGVEEAPALADPELEVSPCCQV
jgi:tRNA-dihydrouridine synthase